MKHAMKILAVFVLVITSTQAVFADESSSNGNWYARVGIGYTEQSNHYDKKIFGTTTWDFRDGANFTASTGFDANFWAVEGEVSYKKFGTKSNFEGDQTQASVMLNFLLHPKQDWIISPYIGAGLGATQISWNNIKIQDDRFTINDSDIVFTHQFIIGTAYKASSNLFLEIDYRYFRSNSVANFEGRAKLDHQELNIFGFAVKYKL
jgi:opacity protein-like surface antigen